MHPATCPPATALQAHLLQHVSARGPHWFCPAHSSPLACVHSWAPGLACSLPRGSPFHAEEPACRVGEAAAETRSDLLEMNEDLCPLCRRVVHCVLPGLTHAVTADSAGLLPVQPAPSLEQLEAHLQAVLLRPDTGPGTPNSTHRCSNVHNTPDVCFLS